MVEGKNAFLDYKKNKLKNSKNWEFSTGPSSWFWPKDEKIFRVFIVGKIGQENVFHDVL